MLQTVTETATNIIKDFTLLGFDKCDPTGDGYENSDFDEDTMDPNPPDL